MPTYTPTRPTPTAGQILDVLLLVAAHAGDFMEHVPNAQALDAHAALLAGRDRGFLTIEGWKIALTDAGRAAVAPWK